MSLFAITEKFVTYLPILVVITTVLSVATFSFLLPKVFDHFNNKNYRDYKEMLDLRKALLDNGLPVDEYIENSINDYKENFLKGRLEKAKSKSKDTFWNDAAGAIGFIFGTTIGLLFLATFIYNLFLGIIFPEGEPFQERIIHILVNVWYIIWLLTHPCG